MQLIYDLIQGGKYESMNKPKAIIMKEKDNVATATEKILPDSEIVVIISTKPIGILVKEAIPFGHKVAIRDITKGEKIIKYGEVIGEATVDIKQGQHVHVHNLVGCRGRGDLMAQ